MATGAVTTLAGTAGQAGNTNGIGVAARFMAPWGLAADGNGNLFVADGFTYSIRKIVIATGEVSTLAGPADLNLTGCTDGIGVAARFGFTRGLTFDANSGNLFVADMGCNSIRKIVISTGEVTTVAGSGNGTMGGTGSTDGIGSAARFHSPYDVTADASGNLYVADTGNFMVRKIKVNTGEVTTVAGLAGTTGSVDGIGTAALFDAPEGIVFDATSGNVFVSDTSNFTIRKIIIASGEVSTVAGSPGIEGITNGAGTIARFSYPQGLTTDALGNLYVADRESYSIRKIVNPSGI